MLLTTITWKEDGVTRCAPVQCRQEITKGCVRSDTAANNFSLSVYVGHSAAGSANDFG